MSTVEFASSLPKLSEAFVKRHLSYTTLVSRLSNAFVSYWKSKQPGLEATLQQPLRTVLTNYDQTGFFLAMPSYMSSEGMFATKLVTVFPGNTDIPTHQGVIMLFDASNGLPLVLVEAEEVTARRTAAASALSSLHLAVENSSTLAILGAGVQAESHIDAHLAVMPQLKRVHVWNRTRARAETLVSAERERWSDSNVIFQVFDSAREAVSEADIVCTVTASHSPILDGDWMQQKGVHVACVGAPRPIWRELETNVMSGSFLVADSTESALKESGDVIAAGKDVDAELGQIIAGDIAVDRERRTVFKSLGIAIEDLVAAKIVYEAYKSQN